MSSLTLTETYSWDLPLLEELGLTPFSTQFNEEIYLGERKLFVGDNASIKVWVDCCGAQFWRFEITRSDGRKFKVTTGGGSLKDYWPMAFSIANDCLTVQEIIE